jgi:hypothetical protein
VIGYDVTHAFLKKRGRNSFPFFLFAADPGSGALATAMPMYLGDLRRRRAANSDNLAFCYLYFFGVQTWLRKSLA